MRWRGANICRERSGDLLAPRAPAGARTGFAPAQHLRLSVLTTYRDIIPDTSNYQIQASQTRLREPVSMRCLPPARYTIGEKLTYLVPGYESGSGDDSGNSVFVARRARGCRPPCGGAESSGERGAGGLRGEGNPRGSDIVDTSTDY